MIVQEAYLQAKILLEKEKIIFSSSEIFSLLQNVLKIEKEELVKNLSKKISKEDYQKFFSLVDRRLKKREPMAYIEGHLFFYNIDLIIKKGVLIPRQETELLVDKICVYLANISRKGKVLLDLCCGSGCIGLSIKKKFPDLRVVLSDISRDAITIARENASINNLSVEIICSDLFSDISMQLDYLVSNPPYLALKEIFLTDPEVRCHEPWTALSGGATGLSFYHRIAKSLKRYLSPKGRAWFEIGYKQGKAIKRIFSKQGFPGKIEKDFSKNDRFFLLDGDRDLCVS